MNLFYLLTTNAKVKEITSNFPLVMRFGEGEQVGWLPELHYFYTIFELLKIHKKVTDFKQLLLK